MKPVKSVVFICLSSLLLLSANSASGQGTWTSLPPMPESAAFIAATAFNGKIYIFGGAPTIASATNKAYLFDPADSSWTALPALPQATCGAGIAVLDNKIYLIGGGDAPLGNNYSTVRIFDPYNQSWSTAASMPAERSLFATGVINGKIYVAGGNSNTGGVNLPDYLYDPGTNTWSQAATMPGGRAFVSSAILGGQLYVIGGTDNISGIGLSKVSIFNPDSLWKIGTSLNTPRWAPASCAVGDKIFTMGGSHWELSMPAEFATVEMYNPANKQWTMVNPMPTARRALSAVVLDNKIYTFGGMKGFSGVGTTSNVVEKFDPDGLIVPVLNTPEYVSGSCLKQNTPNPFSEETTLNVHLEKSGEVNLTVYDAGGSVVQTVVRRQMQSGDYSFRLQASKMHNGIYIAELRVDAVKVDAIKMIVSNR